MKAYSTDLRQKIIDVYLQEKLSQRQLAERFCVALSFIQKLLKQYRTTGQIAARVRIQQTPTKLTEKELKILEELVKSNNDATLDELRHSLAEETGVLISCSTVYRMLKKSRLSLKKNLTRD